MLGFTSYDMWKTRSDRDDTPDWREPDEDDPEYEAWLCLMDELAEVRWPIEDEAYVDALDMEVRLWA